MPLLGEQQAREGPAPLLLVGFKKRKMPDRQHSWQLRGEADSRLLLGENKWYCHNTAVKEDRPLDYSCGMICRRAGKDKRRQFHAFW